MLWTVYCDEDFYNHCLQQCIVVLLCYSVLPNLWSLAKRLFLCYNLLYLGFPSYRIWPQPQNSSYITCHLWSPSPPSTLLRPIVCSWPGHLRSAAYGACWPGLTNFSPLVSPA